MFEEKELAGFVNVASKNLGIPVRYLREFKPLGTGGGLYFFRDVLTRDKPDCILVLHADICADFRLEGTPYTPLQPGVHRDCPRTHPVRIVTGSSRLSNSARGVRVLAVGVNSAVS